MSGNGRVRIHCMRLNWKVDDYSHISYMWNPVAISVGGLRPKSVWVDFTTKKSNHPKTQYLPLEIAPYF